MSSRRRKGDSTAAGTCSTCSLVSPSSQAMTTMSLVSCNCDIRKRLRGDDAEIDGLSVESPSRSRLVRLWPDTWRLHRIHVGIGFSVWYSSMQQTGATTGAVPSCQALVVGSRRFRERSEV